MDNTTDEAERDNIKNGRWITQKEKHQFYWVRKEREKSKNHVFTILKTAFNVLLKLERHDFEIEDYVDQQANTAVDYVYSFQPKSIEPLKKTELNEKSNYWKLLSDFNFNYLPSNINFNTNIIRQYNRQQFRQVEVEGIGIDPMYRRNFAFNYQYGFNFNLTKSVEIELHGFVQQHREKLHERGQRADRQFYHLGQLLGCWTSKPTRTTIGVELPNSIG